jgi:hypothetical protein
MDDNFTDTTLGFVYWQNPMPYDAQQSTNKIRSGQLMDIKLSLVKPERRPDSVLAPIK